jgi:hypothetical protein
MKLTLPDTAPHLPSAPLHGFGRCACHPAGTPPTRRLFTGLLAGSAAWRCRRRCWRRTA